MCGIAGELRLESGERASAEFTQAYTGLARTDRGRKRLDLKLVGRDWRIVRESFHKTR